MRVSKLYIWKARCSFIFHQVRSSPLEMVCNIWLGMIPTLKGHWDCLIGDLEAKPTPRLKFLTL